MSTPEERPPAAGTAPRAPRAAAQDPSLALAMASIRIAKGNPTAEETAALAVLLTARLRRLHEVRRAAAAEPRIPRRRPRAHRPPVPFRAPGSWAS
ncbi:acyl-CoA carboxylase epsilon subunit [Streptomyces sp. NPDC004244]|uniref:acyl-CoA carboxylase epsilon subunit n=1 Tax=Streptomyces sp. NPDC101206 TaxID=3366128 RepID=UPI00382B599B